MYDVIIVGGGIAGMTAAIYTSRGGCSTLLLEKSALGGQISQAGAVENYPGFPHITGLDLSCRMEEQVRRSGADILYETVTCITPERELLTARNRYTAKAVILANGVARRRLGIPGEERLTGRGVSYCAHCDGRLYRGRTAAVAGGGNTALQEALYLSGLCRRVHLIHRRDHFTAQKILQEQVFSRENISVHFDTTITGIFGADRVEQLRLGETTLAVDGLFIAVGYAPDNRFADGLGILDSEGYIAANDSCATSLPWLWAAGDCRKKELRQLVTAAADGAIAAEQALRTIIM